MLVIFLSFISINNVLAFGSFRVAPRLNLAMVAPQKIGEPVAAVAAVGVLVASVFVAAAAFVVGTFVGTTAAAHGQARAIILRDYNQKNYRSTDFSSFDI